MYYTQEQIDHANQADLVSFLQSQGEQITRAGQEYRWETARQPDNPGKQMVSPQPEQRRRAPLILSWSFFRQEPFTEAVALLTGEKGAAPPPDSPCPRPSPTSGYHPGTPTTEQRGTTSQQPAALMKM